MTVKDSCRELTKIVKHLGVLQVGAEEILCCPLGFGRQPWWLMAGKSFGVGHTQRQGHTEVCRHLLRIRQVVKIMRIEGNQCFRLWHKTCVDLELTNLETLWTHHTLEGVTCMVQHYGKITADSQVDGQHNLAGTR